MKKNWQSGTKLQIWTGANEGGDAWLYACPECFREANESDNYCSGCGFYLSGKNVSNLEELIKRFCLFK